MNLEELRVEIDKIDNELIELFQKRMEVAVKIGEYKKNNNIPVLNSQREREKLNDVASKANPEMKSYLRVLYSLLFELSRSHQEKILEKNSELYNNISSATYFQATVLLLVKVLKVHIHKLLVKKCSKTQALCISMIGKRCSLRLSKAFVNTAFCQLKIAQQVQ